MFSITYRLGDFEVVLSADTIDDVLALNDAYNAEEGDGWITWGGGECPFTDSTKVSVRFRSGVESTDDNSEMLYWEHYNTPSDIVAYKVVKNA